MAELDLRRTSVAGKVVHGDNLKSDYFDNQTLINYSILGFNDRNYAYIRVLHWGIL